MRFKLLGPGYEVGTKSYKRGDIVISDDRLDEKFINKFQLLDTLSPDGKAVQPEITVPEKKKGKTKIDKGASSSKSGKKEKAKSKKDDKVDEIKDVTKKFPEAKEAGFAVHKLAKDSYNVIDTDDDTVANDKPLKKDEVLPFVDSQIEGDDGDDDDEDDDSDDDGDEDDDGNEDE